MQARQLPVRRSAQVRRRKPVRRASPRVSPLQVVAVLLMAAMAAGIWVVTAAPAFAIAKVDIHGARFTADSAIRAAARLDEPGNAFRFRSDGAAERLAGLPAVLDARVEVHLPGTVAVYIDERTPVLAWVVGSQRFAVDETGRLFGLLDDADRPVPSASGPVTPRESESPSATPTASPSPSTRASASPSAAQTPTPRGSAGASASAKPASSSSATSPGPKGSPSPNVPPPSLAAAPSAAPQAAGSLALPVVYDRRAAAASLRLGDTIDETTLDAAYRLAKLTPGDVGSTAQSLAVVLDDDHGFTVSSRPRGWVAEFGFYTLTVRRPQDVVVYQVRNLRSFFGSVAEGKVAWVFLTSDLSSSHISSYIPR